MTFTGLVIELKLQERTSAKLNSIPFQYVHCIVSNVRVRLTDLLTAHGIVSSNILNSILKQCNYKRIPLL